MQTLKGRTCVMAGAAQGDGRETVKALCAGGMNVAIVTHQPPMAESLIEEIRTAGSPGVCTVLEGVQGDNSPEFLPEVYEKLEQRFGSVDVIVCNTGDSGRLLPLDQIDTPTLMGDVEYLLGGSFAMFRAALPCLRRSRAARVIFTTTVEGCLGGTRESFANTVGKAAVRGLTLNAAARLAPEGITVNAIAKGPIPRLEGIRPGFADPSDLLPFIPMGRLGTPQDLAAAVCFFASEESGFVTGQILAVDGGMSFGA